MLTQLPILQVLLPLMAAPICLVLRQPRVAWLCALIATCGAFLVSVALLQQVLQHGVIIYEIGGWRAPLGIEYRIDQLNVYFLLIVSAIGALMLLPAHTSIQCELPAQRGRYFYVVYLLCLTGLLGITATGDIFNVFVFLEISSLASYALIALGNNRRALWASFQYLIIGTVGATFVLIGIGLLYAMTGTLNMYDLAQRLPDIADSRTVITAFVFLIVGVSLKLALFPLHQWLPNAYTYAPSIVTALLAATATKVAIYLLIRIIFTVFGVHFAFSTFPLQLILQILGLAGVIVASLLAITQDNIKRMLAYSSVAQIGYMVLGISLANQAGLTATLLHVFNHALMKAALFLAIAAVVYRIGRVQIKDFAGLAKCMPWTMAAIAIGGLSLIGVPLTVGFVSKWYLVIAVLEQGWWPAAIIVLIGSLLAVIYIWRIVEAAYFKPPSIADATTKVTTIKEAPLMLLIPIWLLVAANIYFGIDTRLTLGVSEHAAGILFGAAP